MDVLASHLSTGVLSVAVAAGCAWWVMPPRVRAEIRAWWDGMR